MRPLLSIFLPSVALALDLTPEAGYKELEGIRIPVVRFKDSTGKTRWNPPPGWEMKYEKGILSLTPRDRAQASFEIRVHSRTSGDREVLTNLDSLRAHCARFLPAGAKEITYRGTNEGHFTIGTTPAREYLFDFSQTGQAFRASVSMLDVSERERLIFVVATQATDFEAVRAQAIQSLFSWQSE